MSVRVMVTDSSNRPIANAEVFVSWGSWQHSSRRTNSAGIADLECSGGTIEYIQVWGERVRGSMRVGDNELIRVTYSNR